MRLANNFSFSLQWSSVRLLALDFDGVMTDGFVYSDSTGEEMVRTSRRDSLGISLLKENGVLVAVFTREAHSVVQKRCEKLNIPCLSNIKDKMAALEEFSKTNNLDLSEVCFMGDDITDIAPMKKVGIAVAVGDADIKVKDVAHMITRGAGGFHAVREVCDIILKHKNV